MAGEVLQLHKTPPAADVPATLRRLADSIEAGELSWPVTTAVIVLGHCDSEVPVGNGELRQEAFWSTYGAGPRTDVFTVRGLLASVVNDWGGE